MKYDVIVVGGGASGLALAATLLSERKSLRIAVVERGERLGRKLSATGNGQGNVSNADMRAERFRSGNRALVEKIACGAAYRELFDFIFTSDERGRIYPAGRQASSLTDELRRKISSAYVISGDRAVSVGRGFDVVTESGRRLEGDYLALCTGGKAGRQYGTDGTAYALAESFGHTLTPLYPSLVQLKTPTADIKTLRGIRADCTVRAYEGDRLLGSRRGDVIFADYGVTGNAVFEISPLVTDKQNVHISIEFLPDTDRAEIVDTLLRRRAAGCANAELLGGSLHNQLGRALVARSDGSAEGIADTVKNFTLAVTGTTGFDNAQVTRGGVKMDEVTDELESVFCPKLFLAGELLDVDGDCGGYNLQWAFSSGIHVARSILKRL